MLKLMLTGMAFAMFLTGPAVMASGPDVVEISSGTCGAAGYDDIMDLTACQNANNGLGYSYAATGVASSATYGDLRPRGCAHHSGGNLYVYLHATGPVTTYGHVRGFCTKVATALYALSETTTTGVNPICPSGYQTIVTAADCEAAATEFVGSRIAGYQGTGTWSGNPAGCFKHRPSGERWVYFNLDQGGVTTLSGHAVLCKLTQGKPSTSIPTGKPTGIPTVLPSVNPTASPTANPTADPSAIPSASPTSIPTSLPSSQGDALQGTLQMLYGLVSDVKKQNAELKVQLKEAMDQNSNTTTELKAQLEEVVGQNRNITLKLYQRESCFARRSQN